jgi:hypothetical protein
MAIRQELGSGKAKDYEEFRKDFMLRAKELGIPVSDKDICEAFLKYTHGCK